MGFPECKEFFCCCGIERAVKFNVGEGLPEIIPVADEFVVGEGPRVLPGVLLLLLKGIVLH